LKPTDLSVGFFRSGLWGTLGRLGRENSAGGRGGRGVLALVKNGTVLGRPPTPQNSNTSPATGPPTPKTQRLSIRIPHSLIILNKEKGLL